MFVVTQLREVNAFEEVPILDNRSLFERFGPAKLNPSALDTDVDIPVNPDVSTVELSKTLKRANEEVLASHKNEKKE